MTSHMVCQATTCHDKQIRVLCSGLDSKYVDAVPITQKVIEGILYWDFQVRDVRCRSCCRCHFRCRCRFRFRFRFLAALCRGRVFASIAAVTIINIMS